MTLHPDPVTEPISVRNAIGKDGWIEYRRGFGPGLVEWKRHGFDRPCLTLRKSHMGWKPTIEGQQRRFSREEAKILQSFPESFRFDGDYYETWHKLGNSVPPLLMNAIAHSVHRNFLSALNESGGAIVFVPR